MARYARMYVTLLLLLLAAPLYTTNNYSQILAWNHTSSTESLDQFVSYVVRGFRSVASSLRTLNDELNSRQYPIGRLNLENIYTSVRELELVEKEVKLLDPPENRSATLNTTKEQECMAGWIKYAAKCYSFNHCTTKCTAFRAQAICGTIQAQLAKCLSREQQQFFVRSMNSSSYIILGGSDLIEEGNWLWADGSPMYSGYTNWRQGQPNGDQHENCIYLDVRQDKWHDFSCDYTFRFDQNAGFVCERSISYR